LVIIRFSKKNLKRIKPYSFDLLHECCNFPLMLFEPTQNRHSRIIFFSSFILLLFAVPNLYSQHRVVLIIADDLGTDYCGFYPDHNDTVAIPNIRSLLSRGVLFEQAMSNPVCSATRAGIFTGRYSFRTGVGNIVGGTGGSNPLDTAEMCIPKVLRLADTSINRAQIGKWHLQLGPLPNLLNPNRMGYEHYAGNFSGMLTSYTNWTKVTDGTIGTCANYATTEMTNNAIEWLHAQDPQQSTFLWLAYNAPHTPYHLPPADLITTTGLSGTMGDINQHPVPYFKTSLEALDHEIGRLFDSLRVWNQFENTDFIFIGDNGNATRVAQIADTSRAKGTVYEYGIHVPMIISGPSVVSPGRTSNALVNTADLFATINELMGVNSWQDYIPPSKPVDSKSIVPILLNQTDSIRAWTFSEIFKLEPDSIDGKTIRNRIYKLIRFDYGAEEFYKLSEDPLELTNLLLEPLDNEALENYTYLCNEMQQLLETGPVCQFATTINNQLKPLSLMAYPNPANEQITIESPLACTAYLYTMNGQRINELRLLEGTNTIHASNLSNGLYLLIAPNRFIQKINIIHQ